MYKLSFAVLFATVLNTCAAFAQTDGCPSTCPSNQCANQCFAGSCSHYCVRSVPTPRLAAKPSGDLDLHIPNASPTLTAKIRNLIEDKSAH
jgi:hypothetical protein